MKKLRYLLLLFGLCLWNGSILAQEVGFKVKGCIIDAGNGEPIDFADVLLLRSGDSFSPIVSTPDENGLFVYDKVKNGNYTLMIRLVGYDIYASKEFKIDEQSHIDLGRILLKPLETGLAEVEVVAEKRQVVYKLDKKVVEASKNLLGSGGSAVDILDNTPSIRVSVEGDVSFRGSSGFLVYVDGKPSVFSGTQALEQVPAGQIENIEIITTPSAKHDTDGDVGIINIVTRKHSLKGWSGMVNLSGNTWLTKRADFLFSQQNKRSRWFFGGQWSDKMTKSDFRQDNLTVTDEKSIALNADGPHKGNRLNRSLKAGWALELPATTLEVSAEGGHGGRKHNGDMVYNEIITGKGEEPVNMLYHNINDFENTENFGQGTIGLDHHFDKKGHDISGSFYYKYGGNYMEKSYNELNDMEGNRMDGMCYYEGEFRKTMRGNLDYVLPIADKGKLEAGYQYYSYLEDGDFEMEWWNKADRRFEMLPEYYNTYYFREQLHSVYAVLSAGWKNLEAQAGLRGEHTKTCLNSSIPGRSSADSRFEVFPSAHLGYHFKHDQKIQLGYSYRTTRPQLWYMEPYVTYKDFYSAVIGNPWIRPEYIHSFEMNYQKLFGEHMLTATLFHRSRKDKIERLQVPFKDGVTLDSMANVGKDYSTGLELGVTVRPIRQWTSTLNGNVYHYKVKNELAAGGKKESSTNYDILWNNVFTLGKTTRLQVDGSFVGPSVTTQGRTDTYWYANVAVKQQLLNRKLTATLAVRDLFRSACYINDIQTARLQSYTKIKPKYPQIMLTLSYVFNNFKVKASHDKEDRNEMFEGMNN